MIGRPLRPPTPEPITTGLYGVRYSTAQLVAAGDRMRGQRCLVCAEAIGGLLAVTVVITYYRPDYHASGVLPSSAWLYHAWHGKPTPRRINDLAEWRLGIHPAREDTQP